MKNFRLIGFAVFFFVLPAQAQWQQANWLSLDYIYDQFKYREPGAMSERGALPGVRGEAGLNLTSWLSLGIGGQYASGNLKYNGATFNGTPVKTLTIDRNWQGSAKLHFLFSPFVLSVGQARRYVYNDLMISYRREQIYNYMPITLMYMPAPFYFILEHRDFLDGKNRSHMGDLGGGRNDVTFKQKKGKGSAAEIGYVVPSSPMQTRLSVRYERWDIDASDVQNDGVQDLVEPKNYTEEIIFGIGVIF